MTELAGRTVLVTGASQGIGASTARAFAAEGCNVVLAARSMPALDALAAEIGDRALSVRCDVSRYGDVEAAVASACERFGGLDILIGNAGVIEPVARIDVSDPEGWGRSVDINLKGVYHGMRAALPVMLAAGGGRIITLSSGAAHRPLEGWSHYCAAKAGAAMLTASLHLEYRDRGILAYGLSPGTVATEMQVKIRASGINPVSRMEPSEHVPAELPARALVWMCGAEAEALAGTEISLRDEAILARLR